MDLNPVTIVLLVLIGAALYSALDSALDVTPKVSAWLNRMLGEEEG